MTRFTFSMKAEPILPWLTLRDYPVEPYCGRNGGLQRAVWWAEHFREAPVFPVGTDKVPFIRGWSDPANCARSGEQALGLWRQARPAVSRRLPGLHGECGILLGHGLILVDLDVEQSFDAAGHLTSGYDGEVEFLGLCEAAGLTYAEAVAGALVYRTPGRSGGRHLLFGGAPGAVSKVVPCSGVEVLGAGHYALAAGSLREGRDASGYQLLSVPVRGPLALGTVPPALWDALTGGASCGGPGGALKSPDRLEDFGPGDEVPAGSRHDVCYREAVRAAGAGEPVEEAIRAAVARCAAGFALPGREIARMAENARRHVAENDTQLVVRDGRLILRGRRSV